MEKKLYSEFASLVDAYHRCVKTGNTFSEIHLDTLDYLCDNYMPHGSGIDNGTKLDIDKSSANKLVFTFEYHHMDEYGGYCGWTDHKLTVTPSLTREFDMRISGSNRNGDIDYFYDVFDSALRETIDTQAVYNAMNKV